jgi:hypothetical protein
MIGKHLDAAAGAVMAIESGKTHRENWSTDQVEKF